MLAKLFQNQRTEIPCADGRYSLESQQFSEQFTCGATAEFYDSISFWCLASVSDERNYRPFPGL